MDLLAGIERELPHDKDESFFPANFLALYLLKIVIERFEPSWLRRFLRLSSPHIVLWLVWLTPIKQGDVDEYYLEAKKLFGIRD